MGEQPTGKNLPAWTKAACRSAYDEVFVPNNEAGFRSRELASPSDGAISQVRRFRALLFLLSARFRPLDLLAECRAKLLHVMLKMIELLLVELEQFRH